MAGAPLYGGIEAGGTKFLCIVGTGPAQIVDQVRIGTSQPGPTLQAAVDFFRPYSQRGQLKAIGVGCFGPLDLNRGSVTYGFITSTPKPGWRETDVVGALRAGLGVNVLIHTDVNAAAIGEHTWGATKGLAASLYVTIGTGIGGAFLQYGNPLEGMQHSEMGHILIPHDLKRDPFEGSCPYHGACFEGLASGPAIERRFGKRGELLPDDDPFWEMESEYIAAGLTAFILILSPMRIVLGGGIMRRSFLFPSIRLTVLRLLGNYVRSPALLDHPEPYIVAPGLGEFSGAYGALALAMRADQAL
jgi:fructokinase